MRWFKFMFTGLVLLAIAFFAMFIAEMSRAPSLERKKEHKEKIILDAAVAKKKLETLRKEIDRLASASLYVKKMILADDSAAMEAIKDISRLAVKNGLKDVDIFYSDQNNDGVLAQAGALVLDKDLARTFGLRKARPVFMAIRFEGDYGSLLAFAGDIYDMKTVFSLEQVSIERDDAIMPLQRIFILAAAYMY